MKTLRIMFGAAPSPFRENLTSALVLFAVLAAGDFARFVLHNHFPGFGSFSVAMALCSWGLALDSGFALLEQHRVRTSSS